MKLAQINTVCNISTGGIMGDIQCKVEVSGFETLSIVGGEPLLRMFPVKNAVIMCRFGCAFF